MAASSFALKRLVSPSLLSRYLHPVTPPAASIRFFSTNAAGEYDSDDRDSDDDRRPDPRFFYMFQTGTCINSPVAVASGAIRQKWATKLTADGLHLRLDMPGLGKEDVKVSVEHRTLVVKGAGKKDFEDDDEAGPMYITTIHLPENVLDTTRYEVVSVLFNTNGIKAEMKKGILRVFVPRIEEEERSDVVE